MEKIETATVVEIYPRRVWIDSDFMGDKFVMMQHQGCEPFRYATFHYDYRYTDNASQWASVTALALSLGATDPVPTSPPEFPAVISSEGPGA